jgi:phage terminase small subunit
VQAACCWCLPALGRFGGAGGLVGGLVLGAAGGRVRWSRALFKAKRLQLLTCSPKLAPMKTTKQPTKLTRAQITEGLETVPVSHILGKSVSRELTAKQKAFALEVARGATGAGAYRKAYSPKGKPKTHGDNASRLKGDERIQAEIQAYQLAIEGAKHRNPAALRELVIQSLVKVIIDPESKPGQITAAAKVLGTVTEVAAFTERKEVRTITSSEDARAAIMLQLRELSNASATDAHIIDAQADDLMRELAGSETHPPATPPNLDVTHPATIHTIPPKQSPPISAATPLEPPTQETPPSSSET